MQTCYNSKVNLVLSTKLGLLQAEGCPDDSQPSTRGHQKKKFFNNAFKQKKHTFQNLAPFLISEIALVH